MDRRLSRNAQAPLLVAFSGGGDSLALLLMTHAWARDAGRRLMAVTIDHQLHSQGAAWARWCVRRCEALGVTHRTLIWDGPKPTRGLHAAARMARHELLSQAARDAGAQVIVMGHTADDCLEAAWMRGQGATTPSPREWAPSPVWPGGREIFLLRPLLSLRRAALRVHLREIGEDWIEDPGNDDAASARIRARRVIAQGASPDPGLSPPLSCGSPPMREGPAGDLTAEAHRILDAGEETARAWLGTALVCAGGGDRAPARRALNMLLTRLQSTAPFASTLAGAYLDFDGARLVIVREALDRRASSGADLILQPGEAAVWDGRFEITAQVPGWSVGFAAGRAGRLEKADRQALLTLPACARAGAPTLIGPDGRLFCPTLKPVKGIEIRSLIMTRLAASLGAIEHESAIGHGEMRTPTLNPSDEWEEARQ